MASLLSFSKLKKAVSKIATKVKANVKNAVNFLNTGVLPTSAASVNALNYNNPGNNALQAQYAANPSSSPLSQYGKSSSSSTQSGGSSSGGFIGPIYSGPQLPVTVSAGKQKTSSGSSGGSKSKAPSLDSSVYATITGPITARNMGSGGTTLGAVQGGGGSNAGATSSSSPYSLPTYNQVDPGGANTTELAGGMAGYYTRKDDGTFELVKEDPFGEKSDESIVDEKARLYKEAFGEPESVYEDSEVKRAMRERRQAQQALLAPTAELNAVLSQAQQDTLQLRQTAQKEGVVEAVYGNQVSAINYNAAVRALPLQSHIAALQGNLELADSYLNELVTMKKEQIRTQHDYNKGLFDTIYSALDAKEKRIADNLMRENDRQYKAEDELIDYKAELIAAINAQGDPNGHVRIAAVERSKDKMGAAKAAGNIAKPETAGTGNQSTDNERALMTQFRNEPIVKDFNTILIQKGTIDNYIQNGVGGPADLAIVFSFMKGLDPTSVVRETEYANAAKSGNIFQGAFAKFNGYFKDKGGILPANVRSEFQNLVNLKLSAQQRAYENLATQYTDIANRQGLNPQNVVIDYASGGNTGQSTGDIDYTATLDSIFK